MTHDLSNLFTAQGVDKNQFEVRYATRKRVDGRPLHIRSNSRGGFVALHDANDLALFKRDFPAIMREAVASVVGW